MKSLDEVYAKIGTSQEPRTPISSAPFYISLSGSYYLTTNLTVSSGHAIYILANNVTLDLNGFTLASMAPSATGNAIVVGMGSGVNGVTIVIGFISSGVTNNGAGIYSGPGFAYGICYGAVAPVNVRVSGVSVSGCLYHGIFLGSGDTTVVESCTVRTAGSYGICASTIKNSVATDCGSVAIDGDQVSDSRGESTGDTGLSASIAQNCYGSSSSGTGLYANNNAQNCVGSTVGGVAGVSAHTAQNCYGYSYGGSSSGISAAMANSCYGLSYSGTELSATYGNFCSGSSVSVTYKYNMP